MALRRRRGEGQPGADRVLVAAATKMPLDRKPPIKPKVSKQQKDALAFSRSVPEVKQLLLWRANQIAKLRLYAAAHNPLDPDGEPVPCNDVTSQIDPALAALAHEVVHDFRSNFGGQSEILRRLELNLEAVGELWIVGFGQRPPPLDPREPTPDSPEWIVGSISEVRHKASAQGGKDDPGVWTVSRRPDDKKGRELDRDYDDIFRVWIPDLEWAEMPDTALFGTVGPLQLAQVLSDQMLAEARSRVPAGFFTIPTELTVQRPAAALPKGKQESQAEDMIDTIVTAFTEAVFDPSDPATLAPLLIRGPGDQLTPERLRRVDVSRNTGEELDKRLEGVLERVFRGLDAPIETVKGHMNTTYANAAQVDEDTWEDYLEPRAVLIADAITVGYFREQLTRRAVAANMDPTVIEQIDRMFVWFDASNLIKQPIQSDGADKGLELGAIGSQAWRKAKGFDDSDAPSATEMLLRMAYTRGPLAPNVVVALLRLIDPTIEIPDPEGSAKLGGPGGPGEGVSWMPMLAALMAASENGRGSKPIAALARVKPPTNTIGRRMMEIDRDLRNRLLIAADQSMVRALEHAGNRVRSQTKEGIRELVRDTPAIERVAKVGIERLLAAGMSTEGLLDGAWDRLHGQFMEWGAQSQDDAIELVNRVVGGFTQSQRDALGLRLADTLDEAWTWFKGALTSLAEGQLFNPNPEPTALGEFDPSLRIPPGLVRQAVARVGGAAGITTGDSTGQGGAYLALSNGGTQPASGIATGDILGGAMRDAGASVEAWQWEVGRPRRPFEPHHELDGVIYTGYDDPQVANNLGWPEYPFFMPGDHDGCVCDAIPVVLTSEEASSAGIDISSDEPGEGE